MTAEGLPRVTLAELAEDEPDAEAAIRLHLNGLAPGRMSIETRPQDWAEPARRILLARGAWRGRA